jgi:hypothetical protein
VDVASFLWNACGADPELLSLKSQVNAYACTSQRGSKFHGVIIVCVQDGKTCLQAASHWTGSKSLDMVKFLVGLGGPEQLMQTNNVRNSPNTFSTRVAPTHKSLNTCCPNRVSTRAAPTESQHVLPQHVLPQQSLTQESPQGSEAEFFDGFCMQDGNSCLHTAAGDLPDIALFLMEAGGKDLVMLSNSVSPAMYLCTVSLQCDAAVCTGTKVCSEQMFRPSMIFFIGFKTKCDLDASENICAL